MTKLDFDHKQQKKTFALKMVIRNKDDEPIGTKYFESDTGSQLCDWYNRNQKVKTLNKKKKKRKKKKLTT